MESVPPRDHPIEQPWTSRDVDVVFDDGRRRVEVHDVETPWGDSFSKPLFRFTTDYALVVPVTPTGEFVMVSQYRMGADGVFIEFPAGGIEPGESPLAAAKRELAEEAQLVAGEMIELGAFAKWPDGLSQRGHLFLALNCVDVPAQQEEPTVPFTISPAEARTRLGEMSQGTGFALFLALERLGR